MCDSSFLIRWLVFLKTNLRDASFSLGRFTSPTKRYISKGLGSILGRVVPIWTELCEPLDESSLDESTDLDETALDPTEWKLSPASICSGLDGAPVLAALVRSTASSALTALVGPIASNGSSPTINYLSHAEAGMVSEVVDKLWEEIEKTSMSVFTITSIKYPQADIKISNIIL